MSCNCKNINKIEKMFPNANDNIHQKKGIWKICHKVLAGLQNFGIKICILIMIIIALPIVFLGLSISLFVSKKLTMPLPKKIVQRFINNSKEK